MRAWTDAAARILAPELDWRADPGRHEDLGRGDCFGERHVAALHGAAEGAVRGGAEARLVAGGGAKKIGGNGLVEIEAVAPLRYLTADNHCNVEQWDLVAAPIDERQRDALVRALEDAVGAEATLTELGRETIEAGARPLVAAARADDAALWMEDLASVGVTCRGHATDEGLSVFAERATIDDLDALEEARITLGEVLGEAGHDDWHERWRELLVRLPGG